MYNAPGRRQESVVTAGVRKTVTKVWGAITVISVVVLVVYLLLR